MIRLDSLLLGLVGPDYGGPGTPPDVDVDGRHDGPASTRNGCTGLSSPTTHVSTDDFPAQKGIGQTCLLSFVLPRSKCGFEFLVFAPGHSAVGPRCQAGRIGSMKIASSASSQIREGGGRRDEIKHHDEFWTQLLYKYTSKPPWNVPATYDRVIKL